MPKTGWIGEDDQDQGGQAPAMPATAFILGNRPAPGQGRTLGQALARTAAVPDRRDPEVPDLDERAASLLSRGYAPGAISQLAMRLGDTETELAGEREKLERGARRAEQVMQAHAAGRITAFDIPQLLGDDGDRGRVDQLERQAASLRQQIEQANEAITPPERRDLDPLEAAAQRAHAAFVEVTRARMAEAEAGVRRSGPRPFAGRGIAVRSHAVRSEHCIHCIDQGVSDEDSYLLHSDPELNVPVTSPQQAAAAERAARAKAEWDGYREIAR